TAGRIITLHNLAWLAALVADMRVAIIEGHFEELRRRVWMTWAPGSVPL
ncbi:MAG: tRNA-guanine(34) transglycosylase, partial [Actinomycetia bacterium]|nr:tRNA-guanine(34) transglycosylase [Actinomycetes bacterium]